MGDLVVQQFVSADGFAANDQNEFDGSQTLGSLVAVDYAVVPAD